MSGEIEDPTFSDWKERTGKKDSSGMVFIVTEQSSGSSDFPKPCAFFWYSKARTIDLVDFIKKAA